MKLDCANCTYWDGCCRYEPLGAWDAAPCELDDELFADMGVDDYDDAEQENN